MPWGLKRYQQTRQLHFVTFSCDHCKPPLADPQALDLFVQTLEQAAEKVDKRSRSSPQALKRDAFSMTYGTSKLVPFPKTSAKRTFSATCETVRGWYGFWLIGYVVMPEHVHLLLSEPERKNLALVLQMLKPMVCRNLRPASAKSPFWQARYYDFNVWSEQKGRSSATFTQPGEAWSGGASRGLVVEQLPSLLDRRRGSGRDRIALDRKPTRKGGYLSHRSAARARLKAPPFASR